MIYKFIEIYLAIQVECTTINLTVQILTNDARLLYSWYGYRTC